jgi:hypothetical protein
MKILGLSFSLAPGPRISGDGPGPTTWPGSGWALFCTSLHLLMTFSFHDLLFLKKNDVGKRLRPFDGRKVLKNQKHAKTSKSVS